MEINQESGQIEIEGPYGSVFLYTHNQVQDLIHVVHDVLSKKIRWNDPDYLSRMLFCRMVPLESWEEEGGFGIGTQMYVDIKILITISIVKGEIVITEFNDESRYAVGKIYSFSQFLNNFTDNADL